MPNWKKVIVSGSNAILNDITSSGTFISSDLTGSFYIGTHNVGIDFLSIFPITGSGIIVSQSNLPPNHYNMVKIGEVELVDYNDGIAYPSFLIDTIDKTFIISASSTNNAVVELKAGGHKFYNSSGDSIATFTDNQISIGDDTLNTTVRGDNSLYLYGNTELFIRAGNTLHPGTYNSNNYLPVFSDDPTAGGGSKLTGHSVSEAFTLITGAVTASAVSSSGDLFAGLSLSSDSLNTVMYNTSTGQFFYTGSYGGGGGGVTSLNGLEDAITLVAGPNITITENGQNIEISGSATGNAFTTMSVSGQDDIIADGTNDILTFEAGPGITITTDASTDTIAISASNTDDDWHITSDNLWVTSSRDVAVTGSIHVKGLGDDYGFYLTSSKNSIKIEHEEFNYSTPHNIFIGAKAGDSLSPTEALAYNNIAIGFNAASGGGLMTNIIAIGANTGYSSNSICIGYSAGGSTSTSNHTISIGSSAGYNSNSDNSIFIGKDAGKSLTTDDRLIIGIGTSGIHPLIEGNLKTDKKVEVSGSLYAHVGEGLLTYGNNQSLKPLSGFEQDSGGDAYTYVTPQVTIRAHKLTGAILESGTNSLIQGHPDNYIALAKLGGVVVSGGGGGGTTPDDGEPTVKILGTSLEIQPDNISYGDPSSGLRITPEGTIEFFSSDARTSVSGTLFSVSSSAKIAFNTSSNSMEFFAGSTNESLQKVMFVSRSGRNSRIGIGTDSPQSTFDFKEVQDNNQGTQLFLRSARSDTKGADPNDNAGTINFTIDSGSYNDLSTSGSLAQISTEVTTVSNEGVIGDLILKASTTEKDEPTEIMRLSGQGSTLTGSLETTSYTKSTKIAVGNINPAIISNGSVYIENSLYANNSTRLGLSSDDTHLFNGNVTASNHISASGNIYAGGATFTGDLIVTGSQLITDDITSDGTIRARVKSFDIPHPTRKGKRLVYGALEGPEHGIYCRGESKELEVKLPPEWRTLADKSGITVQITPIGSWQPIYFKKLYNNWLYFGCGDDREEFHFYWEIKGERTDVPKLQTVQ